MVKSKRSFHSSVMSLDEFPAELLFLTFHEFNIPTLLNLCNVCKRFQQIGSKVLSKKFQEPRVEISLAFEQEYKLRHNVQFKISNYNEETGNFVFKPVSIKPMRFINSPMVRSPLLTKISITGLKKDEIKAGSETNLLSTINTTTNINNGINSPSPLFNNNSSIKVKKLKDNFLEKHLALDIKSHKETVNKVQHVYRVGHGTTYLRTPYRFQYSVSDTPPPLMQKTRGGERWLTPISFECSPSFFYPRQPIAQKLIMNITHLRKKNKKKSSSSSSPSSPSSPNYRFEVVEDFISIELLNNQDNTRNNRLLLERQMNQQVQYMTASSTSPRRSTRKFLWGARG